MSSPSSSTETSATRRKISVDQICNADDDEFQVIVDGLTPAS